MKINPQTRNIELELARCVAMLLVVMMCINAQGGLVDALIPGTVIKVEESILQSIKNIW